MSDLQSSAATRVWAWVLGIAGATLVAIVIGAALLSAFDVLPAGNAGNAVTAGTIGSSEQDQTDALAQCGRRLAIFVQARVRSQVCVQRVHFLRNNDGTANDSLIGGIAYVYDHVGDDQKWLWFAFRCRVDENGEVKLAQTGQVTVFGDGDTPPSCDAVYNGLY